MTSLAALPFGLDLPFGWSVYLPSESPLSNALVVAGVALFVLAVVVAMLDRIEGAVVTAGVAFACSMLAIPVSSWHTEDQPTDWAAAAAKQEAEQRAEREAQAAEQDAWFAAEMARHERAMKRVNARADRVLQREAARLGVPVDSIDPRITGDWSRWTYQPDGKLHPADR